MHGQPHISIFITCLKYSVPIFVEEIYKMQRLEVSGAVRPLYGSLGVKGLTKVILLCWHHALHAARLWNNLVNWCVSVRARSPACGYERKRKGVTAMVWRVWEKATFCCQNVQSGCSFSLSWRIKDLHYF